MKYINDGRVNVVQVYGDIRDFLRHGYELIRPRKPEKVRSVTTNTLFGRRKKKRRETITTADVNLKERPDEVVGIVSTGHTRSKGKESDEPFQWSKHDWR